MPFDVVLMDIDTEAGENGEEKKNDANLLKESSQAAESGIYTKI